jgi:hypothetical protein
VRGSRSWQWHRRRGDGPAASIVAGGLVRAAPSPVVVVADTTPVPLLGRPEGV